MTTGMRRFLILTLMIGAAFGTEAQSYRMTFKLEGLKDSTLYIARHFRDQLQVLDTARIQKDGSFTFSGKRTWARGIYALVHQDGEKAVGNFVIDDSRQFTISADE